MRPRRSSTPRRRRSRCRTCPGCWSVRRFRCPPPASGSHRRRWRPRRSWPRTPARCLRRPSELWFCSYQTTQATLSLAPVKVMSGSTPSRLGSTLSVGSPVADEPPFSSSRSRPTCCQQNALTLAASDGLKPVHGLLGAACLTPLETKIWSWLPELETLPSCSCHATHGTGALPGTVAPPATDGFSASLLVWMFSEGTPDPRSWPSGTHVLAVASKRLAKICFWPPSAALGSYHESHGTLRPAPAKSIDGASASAFGSMFRDLPWVTHWPFLNARTKICCELPDCCSNVPQGTRGPLRASEPPTTSDTPAFWLGSIPLAGSLLTCEPSAGRPMTVAYAPAAQMRPAMTASSAIRPKRSRLIAFLSLVWCVVVTRPGGPARDGAAACAPLRRLRSGAAAGSAAAAGGAPHRRRRARDR